jgi:hypothetical protein
VTAEPNYAHVVADDGRGGTLMLPPFVPVSNLDVLRRDFEVHDDDVFVVTYPKAGTTWMEQVVLLLVNSGVQGDLPLGTAVPWVETLPQRPGGLQAFLAGMKGRRLFNSHLPHPLMPGVSSGRGKFVCVIRNPKDVAVSFFHHDRSKNDYEGSWDQYFERFLAGDVHFGRVFEHVRDWWAARTTNDAVLVVSYEEMKADLREVAGRVARFIDVDPKGALLDHIVAESDFRAMANNPKTDLSWVPQRADRPGHYRRGVVGDWRNSFSAEQEARFDAACEQVLAGSGLVFNYG